MIIASRITERLDQLGMSQAELARRVRIGQSSMNALVQGKTRTSREIVAIARELKTTPEYLLGETDDPKIDGRYDSLTADERRMVELTRTLDDHDLDVVRYLIRRLQGSTANETLHDTQRQYRSA